MKKTVKTIKVTEELRKVIEEKLTKKNIPMSTASKALGWNPNKIFSIIRGYVGGLTIDETEQLVCYLPIHKADLNDDFWYRFNNEKQKKTVEWGKEKLKELETKKVAEAKEEPKTLGKTLEKVVAENKPQEDKATKEPVVVNEPEKVEEPAPVSQEEPKPWIRERAQAALKASKVGLAQHERIISSCNLVNLLIKDLVDLIPQYNTEGEEIKASADLIIRKLKYIRDHV